MSLEDNISQVCDFTGLDRVQDRNLVIAALQRKNHDPTAVVTEFYENEAKFRQEYTWDESAWGQDRDGNVNPAGISFNIHPADDAQVIHGVSPSEHYAAPSRPPSRTNNKSPLGKLVEWSSGPAAGVPSTKAEEDEDLQRAIAESVAASGVASPHETGVTPVDTSMPSFGPANRPEYDQSQWAMVPLSKEAAEPPPSARRREHGVPAFLRCRKTGWERHSLGQIITILHEIPAARNVLLQSGITSETPGPATYGHNGEWWKGQPILPPPTQSGQASAHFEETEPNFHEELHRLVAFLDATDRSYGSADNLSSLSSLRTTWDTSVESLFFRQLSMENSPEATRPVWNRVEIASLAPTFEVESRDDFGVLDLNMPSDVPEMVTSLYDLWDLVFWQGPTEGERRHTKIAYLTHAADVQVMRVKSAAHPFEIPPVFYLDRYMQANLETAKKLQDDKGLMWESLGKVKDVEAKITTWVDDEGHPWDNIKMCKRLIQRDELKIWHVKADALWAAHEAAIDTDHEFPYTPSYPGEPFDESLIELTDEQKKAIEYYEALIRKHKRRMELVTKRLANLNDQVKKVHATLKRCNETLTTPSADPDLDPKCKYLLRGVATSPDIAYVCRPAEPDLIQLEDDGQAAEPPDQWWRLAFIADDDDPIKAEMTTLEKVIEAALDEGERKPCLIYASPAAMKAEPVPLSTALQTFVKFDNRLFKQELIEENPRDRKRGANKTLPQSPYKKQHTGRSDSVDSMDTNRASLGDLSDYERDGTFEPDPFEDGDGPLPATATEPPGGAPYPAEPESALPRPPPYEAAAGAGTESPTMGRQSIRLAHVTLGEEQGGDPAETEPQEEPTAGDASAAKGPEMQERGRPPILARRSGDNKVSVMDMDMEIPAESQDD